jgi:hypothetical protein
VARSEALLATERIGATAQRRAFDGRVTETRESPISRLPIAVLLAATAILIPGEAARMLAAPAMSWVGVFQRLESGPFAGPDSMSLS